MVGIIPKPTKKTPKLYNTVSYIAFGLIIAVVLSYATLFYFENKASNNLWDLEEKIAEVGTWDEKALEARVLLNKKKIDDFSRLLQDHKKPSNFLKFLEENCHPRIWFSKIELNISEAQVFFSGETTNFQTIGQQFLIFQNQDIVEDISISNLSIGKDGETNFSFSLSFDPKIFK